LHASKNRIPERKTTIRSIIRRARDHREIGGRVAFF
jgi:hypothetical protein